MQPTPKQYIQAHRATGAVQAAEELQTRLEQAGLAPEYLAVVAAFTEECREARQQANEPMWAHLAADLAEALDFDTAYENQRLALSHTGRPAA